MNDKYKNNNPQYVISYIIRIKTNIYYQNDVK